MPDAHNFALFLVAALIIAAIPGPSILYVAARTLAGGRPAGITSAFGTALGGLVHVVAGAIGISALVLASAQLFTALKFAGAIYLVWLGWQTFRDAAPADLFAGETHDTRNSFRDGIIVEALNPKMAVFFLAFIPQFIAPTSSQAGLQFVIFGLITVGLNTIADIIVVFAAAALRDRATANPGLIRRLRQGSGLVVAGLGVSLALVRRPVAN